MLVAHAPVIADEDRRQAEACERHRPERHHLAPRVAGVATAPRPAAVQRVRRAGGARHRDDVRGPRRERRAPACRSPGREADGRGDHGHAHAPRQPLRERPRVRRDGWLDERLDAVRASSWTSTRRVSRRAAERSLNCPTGFAASAQVATASRGRSRSRPGSRSTRRTSCARSQCRAMTYFSECTESPVLYL